MFIFHCVGKLGPICLYWNLSTLQHASKSYDIDFNLKDNHSIGK